MNNCKSLFNCDKSYYMMNCKNSCCSKNCKQNINVLNSLFCVENFLCNCQKACSLYSIFRLFK